MSTIEKNASYPVADAYWNMVRLALVSIFHMAAAIVDTLRDDIKQHSAEVQLLFYHTDPLEVAALLANESLSPWQIEKYNQLATQNGWSTT